MDKDEYIIISLDARHAQNIFSGKKQVELRRRRMHVTPGSTALIYVKLPVGSIVGQVTISAVQASSRAALWKEYGAVSGLNREEFFEYFQGADCPIVLVLDNARRYSTALSLEEIRRAVEGFHPPQFFSRIDRHHPVLSALHAWEQR